MPTNDHLWLDHIQPTGLVVSKLVLDELGLVPESVGALDNAAVAGLLGGEDGPALPDPLAFLRRILGWPDALLAGLPGSQAVPQQLCVSLAEQDTLLAPTLAVKGAGGQGWSLLVGVEAPGIDPDKRGALAGWEATPHQRFERLLRETGIGTGILIADWPRRADEQNSAELRLIHAPKGETSGWISWPLRSLATVDGRPMLAGLKLLLDSFRLFNDAENRRLPALLKASRERQAEASAKLAGQVLAALYELLRGLDAAEGPLIRELAARDPHHLYEGLLTVLMRLVFILYAEDRDLMPSRRDGDALRLYERGYALRGLFARLEADKALNPDTMDERRGAWGQLLALFRLIYRGHPSGFMQTRGGKLFDENAFPFLMGKYAAEEEDRVPSVSDGCIHRVLESLMMMNAERLSYRTLDVEQIGSVYETVMGFTATPAEGRSLAIKAGKNNKTPVYVNLDALLAVAGKERETVIKESTGRGQLPAAVKRDLKDADSVAALAAALGQIADERGSPRGEVSSAGTPILQPTDERRRTGSHYTPRSLTAPIVTRALEPAFARLGTDATPEAVLALKVCDPACGSGAFLVEATRQIGARLVLAWEHHPRLKPNIPADEDDDLHARRLVAQRCIYGVDRNPMATDLAKLSLWLATLARDHEFSFLDHALKCGDSLVGLTRQQIEGATWEANPQPNLWRLRVQQDVDAALTQREAIRNAPDDVSLGAQETRHAHVDRGLEQVRLIGKALLSAFFAHDKDKVRRAELPDISLAAGSEAWERLRQRAVALDGGAHPIRPFHWDIEFPEVFARDNPGFDAIVGNPPFAGKNTTIASNRAHYLEWLQTLHMGAHGNADLVAHFFRRAFGLIREGGCFGLIATNTIGQGDTRETGLCSIIAGGGSIAHAVKRFKWPGEAAVVVSVVHVVKGEVDAPTLDGRDVRRVSAYLVEGDLDASPTTLAENAGKSFQGSILLGMGFTFDDVNAAKGKASTLAEMKRLIAKDPRNAELIRPYLGGSEAANSPTHAFHRYAIDFGERPLERIDDGKNWHKLDEVERRARIRKGFVTLDYPEAVARDWPDLIEIIERLVKNDRQKQGDEGGRTLWWRHLRPRTELYEKLDGYSHALVINCQATPHYAFANLPASSVFANSLQVFIVKGFASFCSLQARVKEVWTWFFSSSMKDDLRYNPTDCFETFPLPSGYDSAAALEAAGEAYHEHRARVMIATDKGMTKTYNRFHDPHDQAADIAELRRLHAMMDDAVLRAYGWDDLAERAQGADAPRFLTEDDEDDHKYQHRLFWPAAFRDELLARLLRENERRATVERDER